MAMLEDDIRQMSLQNVKFSSSLLNNMHKLKFLVKTKNYSAAKELKHIIQKQEEREIGKAEANLMKRIQKLRANKQRKHTNEYNSIKARLEKSINSKLKQRMIEYERLLLRIQNCHNDMANRQFIEFGKIQSIHAKLLSKYSLNLDELSERQNYLEIPHNDIIQEETENEIQSGEVSPREKFLSEKNFNQMSQKQALKVEPSQEIYEKESLSSKHHFQNIQEEIENNKENITTNTQGQINGYWNKKIIKELKPNTMSDMKDSINLDLSKEPEQILSNFHRVPTEHISDRQSVSSNSSCDSNSSSDSGSSSGSSSSESDSD